MLITSGRNLRNWSTSSSANGNVGDSRRKRNAVGVPLPGNPTRQTVPPLGALALVVVLLARPKAIAGAVAVLAATGAVIATSVIAFCVGAVLLSGWWCLQHHQTPTRPPHARVIGKESQR